MSGTYAFNAIVNGAGRYKRVGLYQDNPNTTFYITRWPCGLNRFEWSICHVRLDGDERVLIDRHIQESSSSERTPPDKAYWDCVCKDCEGCVSPVVTVAVIARCG